MLATLTSNGRVTLPNEIRDRLGLEAGALLDFQLQADGTITVRAVKPDARRVRGLLKSPYATALTEEQVDDRRAKLSAAAARVRGSLSPEFQQLGADEIMRFIRGD